MKLSYTPQELENAIRSGEIDPNLPPAGHKRNEVLAERKDNLEEAAETVSADMGSIPQSVFEEDRDLQRDIRKGFLDLDIGDQYVVKWVNFVSQHSHAVWAAKSEGWKVVNSAMLKAVDHDLVREDNTIRVGDVIAMYIRKDHHLQIEMTRRKKQIAVQYGAEAELNHLAGKHPNALKVHSDLTGGNKYQDQIQRRAARRTAMQHIGNKMKSGTVPGVPLK
jgi:hypothetical protein